MREPYRENLVEENDQWIEEGKVFQGDLREERRTTVIGQRVFF